MARTSGGLQLFTQDDASSRLLIDVPEFQRFVGGGQRRFSTLELLRTGVTFADDPEDVERNVNNRILVRNNEGELIEFGLDPSDVKPVLEPSDIPKSLDLVSINTQTISGDLTGNVTGNLQGNIEGETAQFQNLTVTNTFESAALDTRFDTYATYTKTFYVSADDGDDTNHGQSIGQPLRTIRHAVAQANAFVQSQPLPIKAAGVVVRVSPGTYEEEIPILVEENVSIVGDSLRNVLLFPAPGMEQRDYFHTKSGTYFTGLRFRHLRSPGACVSFPCAICDVRIAEQTVVPPSGHADPPILFSYPGYDTIPPVYVDSPIVSDTTVLRIEVADPGTGYAPSEILPTDLVVTNLDGTDPIEFAHIDSVTIDDGRVTNVTLAQAFDPVRGKVVVVGGKGYDGGAKVEVPAPADPNGRRARLRVIMTDDIAEITITGLDSDGRIAACQITHPGFGYTERPFVSIPPPSSIQPFVIASPYVQNCSNISGPFDTQGNPISALTPLPYDITNVYDSNNNPVQVDPEGSSMGIRVDGACVHPESPLRSFVTDSFTQISQGGIGFLLLNLAYAQLVSTFGTFCATHVKALGGSSVNISNTVTDFGNEGLHARGYWPVPYATATVHVPYADGEPVTDVHRLSSGMYIPGSGYRSELRLQMGTSERGLGYTIDETDPITVTVDPPTRPEPGALTARIDPGPDGTSEPQEFASDPGFGPVSTVLGASSIEDGRLRDTLTLARDGPHLFAGAGYEVVPNVTVTGGSPSIPAELSVQLSGVSPITIQVQGDDKQPEFLSVCRIHGRWHTIQGISPVLDTTGNRVARTYELTLFPPVSFLDETDPIEFFNASYISTNSHVMEFVGSGVTYNALPRFGGIPNSEQEIVEYAPGRVFFTTSDHLGNTKVGRLFQVEQLTGEVSISTDRFNLTGINAIGPFTRDGVPVGVQLREVSTDVQLRSSTGVADGNTVPTQTAVKTYVDRRSVPEPNMGIDGKYLRVLEGNEPPYDWDTLDANMIDKGVLKNEHLPSQITVDHVTASITGDLTGDVTGDLTGNVTGNVTGDVTGDLTGNVTGDLTGDVTGDLTGNVTGDLTGDVTGDLTGNVTGDVTGDLTGDVTGDLNGNVLFHGLDEGDICKVGTTTNHALHVRTDNTDRIRVTSEGRVIIGESDVLNNTYLLDVGGTIYAAGDVVMFSDARFKTHVRPIDRALDRLFRMEGITYVKAGETERKVGLRAQDVQQACPEAVQEDAQGRLSVAYGNLAGLFTEAIKELTAEVRDLRARLQALENPCTES